MVALSCHVDLRAVVATALVVSLAVIGSSVVERRSTSTALARASATRPEHKRQLDTWPAVDFAIAVSSAVTTASTTRPAGRREVIRWRR